MLYFRMLLMMLVTLYTSRVVLDALGVEDFGIYNVVGGVVVMFGFLNSAMSSATQRFLSYELGKNDLIQFKNTFSVLLVIHIIIAFAILFLAETFGLWFLNNKLKIPIDRLVAANWVYQFSILAFMVNVITVPYNAAIISHEKMKVYAYVSVIEVLLKLFIVFLLQWFEYDKLALYAVFIFIVSAFTKLIYIVYCYTKLKACHFSFVNDFKQYKAILEYSVWNLFGGLSVVAVNQGLNILLNIFFGPAINAARGIAYQVNGALTTFISNFQTAVNPQLVKQYAKNEIDSMLKLIYGNSKYSFFLIYLLSLPVFLNAELILKIWLKDVPIYSSIFLRLVLINSWINSLSGTFITSIQATGKIKLYQFVVGSVLMLLLPISYILLKYFPSPEIVFYAHIIINSIALILRIYFVSAYIPISYYNYSKLVILPCLYVVIPTMLISINLYMFSTTIVSVLLLTFITYIINLTFCFFFGLDRHEKNILKSIFIKYVHSKITK